MKVVVRKTDKTGSQRVVVHKRNIKGLFWKMLVSYEIRGYRWMIESMCVCAVNINLIPGTSKKRRKRLLNRERMQGNIS